MPKVVAAPSAEAEKGQKSTVTTAKMSAVILFISPPPFIRTHDTAFFSILHHAPFSYPYPFLVYQTKGKVTSKSNAIFAF